ncbi:MAG TPA: ribosome maturation factor RimM [Terriglobales bacterium]|jgi:16S rRNA processing protein RimM|nr:ribosome maturation factor RimM [Terriglobales bacterium]
MTASPGGTAEEFVTLARVIKTQGRHGEVAVQVHSDIPDRLHPGLRLFALAQDNSRRELQIDDAWPHKDWLVLKFAGVDSISDAELLIGSELQVPASERAELEAGAAYVSDLIGCVLFDRDREIGAIRDVRFGAGEAPLLVMGSGKNELEIPYAQEFLVRVDLEGKRLDMNLPEGLLEVNAPLTEEEKREQTRSSSS